MLYVSVGQGRRLPAVSFPFPLPSPRLPQRMACRFPLEIFELIIDECRDSLKTLESSSLVSWAWLSRCRKHLFRHLSLRYTHRSSMTDHKNVEWKGCRQDEEGVFVPERLEKPGQICTLGVLLQVPQIRMCIRELSFTGKESDSGWGEQHFGRALFDLAANSHFPNLCSLSISFREPEDPWNIAALDKFLCVNSTLERLSLSCLQLDDASVQAFIVCLRASAQLKSLQLERILWLGRADTLDSFRSSSASGNLEVTSRFPVLRKLVLIEVDPGLANLFTPGTTFCMKKLHALATTWQDLASCCDGGAESAGSRLISASSLAHLALRGPPTMPGINYHELFKTLISAKLPYLTTLEVNFVNVHDGSFQKVLGHLSSLESPLSLLRIGLKYGPRKPFLPGVDRALTNLVQSCQSLRRVEFRVSTFIDDFCCDYLPGIAGKLFIEIEKQDIGQWNDDI
ncbi:hypothetical protein GYMLUDRAFT_637933 [Collybiopsis luxurians FD-317 M1]|nr:hypothetical protein GYMLUDRAFT_637933 [Collybiopsis luxurians FD-317 M1]